MVIYMKAIETALSLTKAYKLGIERFEKMLGNEFSKAVESMNNTSTHIIICGMGKSGLVGRKISSTLHLQEHQAFSFIQLKPSTEI